MVRAGDCRRSCVARQVGHQEVHLLQETHFLLMPYTPCCTELKMNEASHEHTNNSSGQTDDINKQVIISSWQNIELPVMRVGLDPPPKIEHEQVER